MDIDIHYPYGIPFYTKEPIIPVLFINNDQDFFWIYFVKNKQVDKLAGIVFPNDKKKFHFPENSLIAIITQSKPREVYRYIKLKPNMIYIYP